MFLSVLVTAVTMYIFNFILLKKNFYFIVDYRDFPGGSDSKESVFNSGDPGSIPG